MCIRLHKAKMLKNQQNNNLSINFFKIDIEIINFYIYIIHVKY